MAAEDFTLVRLRKTTLARLRREIECMLLDRCVDEHLGGERCPDQINPKAGDISPDVFLNHLLDMRDRRRMRRILYARRRRARAKPLPKNCPVPD